MDESDSEKPEADPPEAQPPASRGRPVIKRRWAILRGAGGGVAVIAMAGAIALGDPTDQADYSGDPGGGDTQISVES